MGYAKQLILVLPFYILTSNKSNLLTAWTQISDVIPFQSFLIISQWKLRAKSGPNTYVANQTEQKTAFP